MLYAYFLSSILLHLCFFYDLFRSYPLLISSDFVLLLRSSREAFKNQ